MDDKYECLHGWIFGMFVLENLDKYLWGITAGLSTTMLSVYKIHHRLWIEHSP